MATTAPSFRTRLGTLYLDLVAADAPPKPAELEKVNQVFHKALGLAPSDASVLKDAADYFAASQQTKEAIPPYIRAPELHPNDSVAQENLATGSILPTPRGAAPPVRGQ